MIYDITKPTAPAMPNLGKGLELPKLLFSQVSKDMQEAVSVSAMQPCPYFFISLPLLRE